MCALHQPVGCLDAGHASVECDAAPHRDVPQSPVVPPGHQLGPPGLVQRPWPEQGGAGLRRCFLPLPTSKHATSHGTHTCPTHTNLFVLSSPGPSFKQPPDSYSVRCQGQGLVVWHSHVTSCLPSAPSPPPHIPPPSIVVGFEPSTPPRVDTFGGTWSKQQRGGVPRHPLRQ